VSAVISWVGFWPFWLRLSSLRPELLGGRISLKFLLESKLESESFEPLIGFLAFLV